LFGVFPQPANAVGCYKHFGKNFSGVIPRGPFTVFLTSTDICTLALASRVHDASRHD